MMGRSQAQRLVVYVGGFIGPFTGQALAVILPEFGDSFGITLSQAALTLSCYLLPFAFVMLFSTRLVQGLSPTKVILSAYAVTAACAVVTVLSPWWWLFLVGYTVMGTANAFTTPVLQIVLKRSTPPDKLGNVLGTYTAMQSLGIFSAPLIAGAAVGVTWRIIFMITLVVSVLTLIIRVPQLPATPVARRDPAQRVDWGATSVRMLACLAIGHAVIGFAFIVALYVGDVFGLSPIQRGLVVMCGGLLAFLVSRPLGRVADRVGPWRVLAISLVVAAAVIAAFPVIGAPWLAALLWGVAVSAAQAGQTSINMLVLRSRGGEKVLSTVQAFRYFGSSSTPMVLLPIYTASATAGFVVPAALLLVAAGAQLARR